LWIPALISAVTGTGGLIRIMRGNLLETMGQPFVEAARARGLKNTTVTWKHAVRIAINPLIVILGSEALPSIIPALLWFQLSSTCRPSARSL
jgi:peptide/nickel transport system permease protein